MTSYRINDPESHRPRHLVIAPPSIRIEHTERGLLMEVFQMEGMELDLEVYRCSDPDCNCPDDYYLDMSIKISRAEYDRIRAQPNWQRREADD